MILKILVLLASVGQVVGAAYLSIGTFEQSERILPVFIQPAGWAFSIWGLIYSLSIIYGIYQIIPKYDNQLLRKTRMPALLAFTGSVAWLYFAGMSSWLVWFTIPVLFIMALVLTRVVVASENGNSWQSRLSKYILLPYAAWAGIASWINVQALLIERGVITSEFINILSNAVLFLGIICFTSFYFKKSQYNVWYGGVIIWASVSVAIINIQEGSVWFALAAGIFALTTIGLLVRNWLK